MNKETTNLNLSQHILPNSTMMIGVCMTVISITKVIGLHTGEHRIANVFAFDGLIFLTSVLLSYFSIRSQSNFFSADAMEKIADIAFIVGITIMTVAGFLLTYELI